MAPKRRQASTKQAAKAKQPKQDGQKAVSHDIDVPLDEGFKEDGKSCNAASLHLLSHRI